MKDQPDATFYRSGNVNWHNWCRIWLNEGSTDFNDKDWPKVNAQKFLKKPFEWSCSNILIMIKTIQIEILL